MGLVLLALATASCCGVRSLSRAMMFPGSPVAFPEGKALREAHPDAVLVDYRARDGQPLRGAWCRPPQGVKTSGAILFFHGNGESAAQNLEFGDELAEAGWRVFLAEYRGYGGLPGHPSEEGLYLDGEAALELVEGEVGRGSVVLVGRSLGTGVAVELAARGHGRALVLVSPYTSMVDLGRRMVGGMLARLAVADRFDNAGKIGRIELPVTVIHGTDDNVVPYAMGEAIAKACKNGRLITVAHHGHNDLPGLAAIIDRALR